MFNKIRSDYGHTIYAGYIGYVTQAIVNNFAPLLFVTFAVTYNLGLDKITMLTAVNFFVQLCVDLLSAKLADKIGYRASIVAAHLFAACGLVGMTVFPSLFGDAFLGLLAAAVLYAVGGGIIEVLVSPIVEACPTEKKEAAMSLVHSFYCWGQVFLVLVSTLFFHFFGIGQWRILAWIWAVIPLFNLVYFLLVPIYPIAAGKERMSAGKLLTQKTFWILIVIMICAGASEMAMSQWASAFAESGLKVSKTVGDLAGPCAFAVFMGTSRTIYAKCSDRISLRSFMVVSAVLCVFCYIVAAFSGNPFAALAGCAFCGFSVGIFWPGTFSLAAEKLPGGGTAMYAFLALAGDVGCFSGPSVVGMAAGAAGDNLKAGLGAAVIFPLLILLGIFLLGKKDGRNTAL